MPVIDATYHPSFFLRHRHLSTIYPALYRTVDVAYQRRTFITPDEDFFDADLLQGSNRKLLVILHGLEGSSGSQYVKGLARLFHATGGHVYALNFRSCSGRPNKQLYSYHSGFTSDLVTFIQTITEEGEFDEINLVGFSLGGNVVLKYLGEEVVNPAIRKAVAVSVPVYLKGSAEVLSKGFNRVYMQRFLKSLVYKIKEKAELFPGRLDLTGIDQVKDFKTFDERYTAPINGFNSAEDYWEKCSSLYAMPHIRTNTLLLNALNDPFLSEASYPADLLKDHDFVTGCFTSYGGHAGFYQGDAPTFAEEMIMRFLAND